MNKIEIVTKVVAEHFGLTMMQIKEKTRNRTISYPRQIAMYILKEKYYGSVMTISQIGRYFNKNHATALYAHRKIKGYLTYDNNLRSKINKLNEIIDYELKKAKEEELIKEEMKGIRLILKTKQNNQYLEVEIDEDQKRRMRVLLSSLYPESTSNKYEILIKTA